MQLVKNQGLGRRDKSPCIQTAYFKIQDKTTILVVNAKTDTWCSLSLTNSSICISFVSVGVTAVALLYVHPSITPTWRPLTNSTVALYTEPRDFGLHSGT